MAEENTTGTVTGKALTNTGKPLKNAVMLFYTKESATPPAPERYWRIPDATVGVDANGKFTADLAEGEYFIGAIARKTAPEPGPPREGDILLLARDKQGNAKPFAITKNKTTDIGSYKGYPYRKSAKKPKTVITSIEGTITSQDGQPVSGMVVFAFFNKELKGKPLFATERTDKSGKYVLRVDKGETYFLKARVTYGGGTPPDGQLIGAYGGDDALPVVIKTGEKKTRVDITVSPFGRGGTP